MHVVDVSIRVEITDRESEAAESLGLTNDEYARRKMIMLSQGWLNYDHKTFTLQPSGCWNQFLVKELSIG